jgi:hypothetical protein
LAYSQTSRTDAIYLTNGTVIKGVIIEHNPGKSYTIRTEEGSTFIYRVEEVEKITSESDSDYSSAKRRAKEPRFKTNGWSGLIKLGPMGLRSFTASTVIGYSFEGILFLGAGASIDAYKNIGHVSQPYPISDLDLFMPVFMDFRVFTSPNRTAFMWCLEMGYSPLLSSAIHYQNTTQSLDSYNKTSKGGVYYATAMGFRIFTTHRMALLLEFGIKIQSYTIEKYTSQTSHTNMNVSPKMTATPYFNVGLKF